MIMQSDVAEFHEKMGQAIGDPRHPDVDIDTQLRWELIREEFEELTRALEGKGKDGPVDGKERVVAVADALGDMVYVIAGAAVTWGIDLGGVFQAIHTSNMTKSKDNKRKDGKILKGPKYSPPDIQGALDNAKAEAEFYGFGPDAYWPQPTIVHTELPVAEVKKELHEVLKEIKADFLPHAGTDENYPLLNPEVWSDPGANKSFGQNEMPAEMSERFAVRATDTVMGVPISEPEERDTEPTILYNGQFLNRGAFIFDCPCGRTQEIITRLGSRGGLASNGSTTCICGKIYKVAFSRSNGEEHAEFTVEDGGGHS